MRRDPAPRLRSRLRKRVRRLVRVWSWCCDWNFDASVYQPADAGLIVINGSVVAFLYNAIGLAGVNLFVLLVDAAIEVVGFALETVLVCALLLDVALVAAAGSEERGFEGRQQEDGEVRLEVVAGGAMHGEDA